MSPEEYRIAREARGTQMAVAKKLGEHWRTIQRREAGDTRITRSAELALLSIRKRRKSHPGTSTGPFSGKASTRSSKSTP